MRRIEKIQDTIQQQIKPIRLQGLLKKRNESPTEFLVKFFTKWNNEKDTLFVENKSVQTDTGRRRSIGDIYRIMQHYYPDITLEEVTRILYQELPEKVERFRSSYCSTINKRVFYQGDETQSGKFYDHEEVDEHDMKIEQWRRQIRKK